MKTLRNVGTEMALHVLAYNMKRVIQHSGRGWFDGGDPGIGSDSQEAGPSGPATVNIFVFTQPGSEAAAPRRRTAGRCMGRHRVRAEIEVPCQTIDAIRLHGADTVWNRAGQRLLDDTCQQRTGRHEEDGCWPSFE